MKYLENYIEGNHSIGYEIEPKGIVLHHTGDYSKHSITYTFTNRESSASAHVVIWKDGNRTQFCKDNQRAWHAGVSEFKGWKGCNNFMIGVEFEGDTNKEPLTKEQIESFIEWLIPRIEQYKFSIDWVTDHRTVSPGRKVDLNPKELKRVLTAIKYLWL
ncbi:amidase [Rhodobacteraceae phage LS06-2018-MD05]|nr:amidase [Rhodobacteraceae phage LS06-2018-MD05]